MASPLRSPHVVEPDFASEAFHRDPYRHYASYRSKTPVFRNRHDVVYLTRHRDCELLLSDPRFLRQRPGGSGTNPYIPTQAEPNALDLMVGHWIIFMDPPRHDVVRRAFSAPFTAKLVRLLEPAIHDIAQELITAWRGHASIDLVSAFASPLPIFVLCRILGIPRDDWQRFDAWSSQLTRAMDSGIPAEMRNAIPVSLEIHAYFSDLVRARTARPQDDFLGELIAAAKAGALTEDELVYGIAFLILAGHETTKNLIAAGAMTLAAHAGAAREISREPALLDSAIEELLRFESPFQKLTRYPAVDASFGEYAVGAGTIVVALVGAANRDPDVFADPERFDIRRSPNRHLSFSKGVHACLGTVLARVESRIAFGALLEALPRMEVTDHRWRLKSSFRALERLTLVLDRSAARLPRSAVAALRFPALPDARGSRALAMQYQLERSQWLPPEALLRHQMTQLRLVLDHAARTVPYYRDLFAAHGITVPDALDVEFLRRVPISARAAIRDAGDALRSERIPSEHGRARPVVTSGSTGQPVRMLGNAMTEFFWEAFALRDHLWHERDFSRKLAAIRWAAKGTAQAPDGARWPTWGRIVDPVFESGPSCMLDVTTPPEDQIAWLLRERPDYLLSFPSNLDTLARHCLRHGIDLRFLEVRTVGETLNPDQITLYERAWSCRVVDIYTCEETGYLALQCPTQPHFHVQSENVFLEIVDDAGLPCAPGETGRVLVTTLNNFATPLVRYELGDYAVVGERCPCGRGLPVITRVLGRRRNRLVYPDGRTAFPYLGEHTDVYDLTGVRISAFQVIQHGVEDIEVRLVTDRRFTPEETVEVTRYAQRTLGHPFHIAITYWDEIPRSGRGKFEEFVSEVGS